MKKSIIILLLFHVVISNICSKGLGNCLPKKASITKDTTVTIFLGEDKTGKQILFSVIPSTSNYGYDLEVFYLVKGNKNVVWNSVGSIDTIQYIKNGAIVYYNASGGGFDNSYKIKIDKGKLLVTKIREYGFPSSILKKLKREGVDFTFSMSDDLEEISYQALRRIRIDTFHEQSKFYFLLNENNYGLQMKNPSAEKWYQYILECDAMMLNCKILDKFDPRLELKLIKNPSSEIPLISYSKNNNKFILEYKKRKYRIKKIYQ